MRVVGVICEYNPFHNGHAYHLAQARARARADYVVCVMSGCFTQRGEPALVDKWIRARMALSGGADLVLELPFAFSCAQAERFARGGVALLASLGAVTHLSVGCEEQSLPYLRQATELLGEEPPAFRAALARALARGCSFPRARAQALCETLGLHEEDAPALAQPNFSLAAEYQRALRELAPAVKALPVARSGSGYHEEALSPLASATAIRLAARRGEWQALHTAMPDADLLQAAFAEGRCADPDAFSTLWLYRLRTMRLCNLRALYDMPEGLENRILRCAQDAATYEQLVTGIKSKRYTRARITRMLLHALVGFTREQAQASPLPSYARVLGFREDAAPLLRHLKGSSSVPLVLRAAPFERQADPLFCLDVRATDVWALCCTAPDARLGRRDARTSPVILRS